MKKEDELKPYFSRSRKPSGKEDQTGYAKFSPSWVVYHLRDAPAYRLEVLNRIRTGVSKEEWKDLIRELSFSEKDFEHVLPSSISSMQKRNVYDKETSERIYEISRLFAIGNEVFDSPTDFKNWLHASSKPLGGKKPFELLDSSIGFELVTNEIYRIQHNVYS